ncbi:MAG: formylglycine-generating enzyme family protein [Fibrobacter sp.]|nr:formylglycine-generating enzyme family protein [Fibrobacter sp.]
MSNFKSSSLKTILVSIILWFSTALAGQSVQITGGSFTMGDNNGEADEVPEHEVAISSFSLDRYQVTEKEYDSCVRAGKCTPAHYDNCMVWSRGKFMSVKVPSSYRNPDYPVVCITWYQAQAYCRFKGKTLPSEAQWEYAAKAGQKYTYAWGDSPPSSQNCPFSEKKHPQKTGSYKPNSWGLYDMTGNVWEWVSDFYERDYYSFSEKRDPQGPQAGLYRVIRGGGWYSGKKQLRITNRHWFSPAYPEVSIGFRCTKK